VSSVLGTLGLGRVGRLALPTNLPSLGQASDRVLVYSQRPSLISLAKVYYVKTQAKAGGGSSLIDYTVVRSSDLVLKIIPFSINIK
jgi:hypothetical protein